MADAALARREARRKRILENSHNRLQLISNITNDECCKESPVKNIKTGPITEQNIEVPATTIENNPMRSTIYNGVSNQNEPVSFGPLSDNNLRDLFFGAPDSTSDSTAFALPKPEPAKISFFEKFSNHKYDLVFLSLCMQLLYSLSITLDNTYFFLPVILYSATKLLFFPKEESFNYANILLLLNGMSSHQAHKLMSILQWGGIVVQDMCIYLFVTICVESLCIVIYDSLFYSI